MGKRKWIFCRSWKEKPRKLGIDLIWSWRWRKNMIRNTSLKKDERKSKSIRSQFFYFLLITILNSLFWLFHILLTKSPRIVLSFKWLNRKILWGIRQLRLKNEYGFDCKINFFYFRFMMPCTYTTKHWWKQSWLIFLLFLFLIMILMNLLRFLLLVNSLISSLLCIQICLSSNTAGLIIRINS